MSNVLELRKDLVDKVVSLSSGKEFLGYPSFVAILLEVSSLIGQMNISDPSKVYVSEHDGKFSFEYTSGTGDKYSFELTANEKSVRCVRVEEPHSFVGNSAQVVRSKEAIDKVAMLGENGEVTLVTNYGTINNIDCDNTHYNMSSSVEKVIYNKNGVMTEKAYKYYESRQGEGYFHRVGANELLSFARWIPRYSRWNDSFSTRTLLRRDQLDTAKMVYQDKRSGYEYYGVVPLHQEHGLRDMFIATGYNTYPVPEVEIHSLMQAEVDAMINRESDFRIAEGLREYAKGRTTYHYKSSDSGQYSGAKAV